VALYILFNVLLSFTTFYYDRSNIKQPIEWLTKNIKQNDILFTFSSELELHGGKELVGKAYLIFPTRATENIKEVLKIVDKDNIGDIYYIYTHHYQFKNKLYKSTTGINRTPATDLYRYIRDVIPGEKVISDLRGCGLNKYKKAEMVTGLQKLLKDGYPKPEHKYLSIHFRAVVKVLDVIGGRERIAAYLNKK
ncbi:MAG: hypothetical protein ABIH39_03175, partial [Candidatus Margulisiibacteriota bacterium]